MATKTITFDPNKQATLGSLKVIDDPTGPKISEEDKKSLLHLMFFYTYDKVGREFLRKNRPSEGAKVADVRGALTTAFTENFNITDATLMAALIDSHLAGDEYAEFVRKKDRGDALTAQEVSRMKAAETAYEVNLQVIMDFLHDDAMGKEFSMNW